MIHSKFFDDNSFFICQRVLPENAKSKSLEFGPLSATLGDLFRCGWFMAGNGFTGGRYITIRLRHNDRPDEYRLFKHRQCDLFRLSDMSHLVRDGRQVLYKGSYREIDPMTSLMMKYPVAKKRRPVMMVGNQTLSEFLDTA